MPRAFVDMRCQIFLERQPDLCCDAGRFRDVLAKTSVHTQVCVQLLCRPRTVFQNAHIVDAQAQLAKATDVFGADALGAAKAVGEQRFAIPRKVLVVVCAAKIGCPGIAFWRDRGFRKGPTDKADD